MSDPRALPPASVPPGQDADQGHYLRAVADMASHCCVTTRQALYNEQGIKLLDQGVRVDSGLYDRLVRHKLRGHLDEQLAVEDMVDVQAVAQEAAAQCESDALIRMLVGARPDIGAAQLLALVRGMTLPQPLAFKLTVMREQRAELYRHSVRMMLASIFLGLASGMGARECVHLAAAALLHDIGVLHMSPAWSDPDRRLNVAERRELMAHPVTAALLIRAQQIYPASVAQAVLEHHECLDGSGYPRGLRGEQISPMGQVLMLAEVAAAFFEKYASDGAAQRLSLMLRMNHRKFAAPLAACLLPALDAQAAQAPLQVTPGQVQAQIELLSQAFADWDARCMALPPSAFAQDGGRCCVFVTQRLMILQKALFEAGSHPQQQAEALAYLQDDAQSLAELALLGREALWQLRSVADAVNGRWPKLQGSDDACDRAVLDWVKALLAQMQEMAIAAP